MSRNSRPIENKTTDYYDFFEHSPDMLFLINTEGIILDCNQTACSQTGYSKQELLDHSLFAICTPLSQDKAKQAIKKLHTSNQVDNIEIAIQRKNQNTLPTLLSMTACRDQKTNQLLFARSSLKNIASYQSTKSAVSFQRESTESLLESLWQIFSCFFLEDFPNGLTLGLQKANEFLNTSIGIVSHIQGKIYTIKHCHTKGILLRPAQEFPLGNTYCNLTIKQKEFLALNQAGTSEYRGHPCYQEFELETYIGVPLRINDTIYGTLNFSDITPRPEPWTNLEAKFVQLLGKWVEAVIFFADTRELQEEKLAALFSSSPTIFYTLQPQEDFAMSSISPNAKKIFDDKANPFPPTFWIDSLHPDDKKRVRQNLQDLCAHKMTTYKDQYRFLQKDGTYHWVQSQMNLSKKPKSNSVKIVGSFFDIEDEKNRENARKKENQELENFVSVASHDLQEPLRIISSYVSLFASKYETKLDATAEKYIRYIVEGATNMQRLIKNLLQYSRVQKEPAKVEVLPIQNSLALALQNLKTPIKTSQATIEIETLPIVLGNQDRLQIVFQHLISNSLKFCQTIPKILIGSKKESNGFYTIFVKDNGIGIDSKYHSQVFEVFQRLHSSSKGNGIGLALVKKIIIQHGGNLWLESKPENGTTIFFSLPGIQENSQ